MMMMMIMLASSADQALRYRQKRASLVFLPPRRQKRSPSVTTYDLPLQAARGVL